MDLDEFEIDEHELEEAEKRREWKLAEDEKPVVTDNDCESCKI